MLGIILAKWVMTIRNVMRVMPVDEAVVETNAMAMLAKRIGDRAVMSRPNGALVILKSVCGLSYMQKPS